MSENEIKPVAWMVDEQSMTGDLGTRLYWARNGGAPPSFGQNHSPLYDQSAIDRLTAERDALRADAERYRYLRDVWGGVQSIAHTGEHRAQISTPSWRGDFDTLDGAIDAARAQEPQA